MADLIKYLPPVLREVREYKALADVVNPRIDRLNSELARTLDNMFVASADDYGLSRWEALLGIRPADTDTLEDRRVRIILRLNESLPYTMRRLVLTLDSICGSDGYTIELFNQEYRLKVLVELVVKSQFESVRDMLKRVIPANLTLEISLRYMTYGELLRYRHVYLKGLTYKQVRERGAPVFEEYGTYRPLTCKEMTSLAYVKLREGVKD